MHPESGSATQENPISALEAVPDDQEIGPAPKRWTVLACFLLLLGFLGIQLLIGFVLSFGALLSGEGMESDWFVPSLLLFTQFGSLGLLWANRHRLGAKPLWNPVELRDRRGWALSGAAFLIVAVANAARIFLQPETPLPTVNEAMLAVMSNSPSTPWLLLIILGFSMVILAPLAEEWLFRGILQSALGARWGPWVAIPVTAGLFAVFHDFSTWSVVFVYGIVWGALVYRRNSLTFSVVAHAVWNLTTFLLILSAG